MTGYRSRPAGVSRYSNRAGCSAVLPALEDARADERAQPGGQGVARRAGPADHLVEPAVAEEHLADREQRPLLADDRRACERPSTSRGVAGRLRIVMTSSIRQ